MLTMDAKRNAESYAYPNGMLNTGWIAGVLRLPDPANGICYIQQTRSENHMLPIHFDPKTSPLPRDLKEWDLVMAYCHVNGGRDGDQRVVSLKSIRFEAANALHMDKKFATALLQKWAVHVHEAAKDSGTPDAIRKLGEAHGQPDAASRVDSFDWKAMKMNHNASNHVRLAGFIEAKSYETNRVGLDGKPMNDRLVVLLRQTADPDRSIAVRWYSRNLKPLHEALQRRMPIIVTGEFRLDVKAIGAPDPATGIAPVSKIPYIQAKDIPQPVLPGSDAIRVVPHWLSTMLSRDAELAPETPAAAPASAPEVNSESAKLFAATFATEKNEGDANG